MYKFIQYFMLTAISLGFMSPLQAENLQAVYALALANDPQFRAAEADSQANKESRPQAKAAFLPQISLTGNVADNNNETNNSGFGLNGDDDFSSNEFSVTLQQTIYKHSNYASLRQARAQFSQAETQLNAARQDLILRAAERYFRVLGAQDNLEFAGAERTSIKHQLRQTQQRFRVGVTAITDVHEAQARYDQAVAQEIVAQNLLASGMEELREITNHEHKVLARLSKKAPLVPPEPQDIDQWVKTALAQNTLLHTSKKSVDIAREQISSERGNHYPEVSLVASHSQSNTKDSIRGSEFDSTRILLQLNVPIYSGGFTSSRVRQAAFLYEKAKQEYTQQRRATERQARNSYLTVLANISQVKALNQALTSSRTALKATQAGFTVGTRTTVDVLDSQRELFRAQRDYSRARYDYYLETLRLKQAAGTLFSTDLEQISHWLEE